MLILYTIFWIIGRVLTEKNKNLFLNLAYIEKLLYNNSYSFGRGLKCAAAKTEKFFGGVK